MINGLWAEQVICREAGGPWSVEEEIDDGIRPYAQTRGGQAAPLVTVKRHELPQEYVPFKYPPELFVCKDT